MIVAVLTNLNFWSAFCGLLGSVILFFFGLPPKIDPNGHVNLILEQVDKNEIKKGNFYKKAGYLGLFLLILSFLIQTISIISTVNPLV